MIRPNSITQHRRVHSRPFVASGSDTFPIPRGNDLNAVVVEITGTVQLTTGATTLSEFGAAMLARRIQLVADGGKKFADREGFMAAFGNFEMGLAREITNPGTGIATHNVSVQFVIDLASYGCPRPKDSALHTSLPYMTLLDLNIDYGAILDMYSAAGAAVVGAVNLTTNVYLEEILEATPEGLTEERWLRRVWPFEIKEATSKVGHQLALPTGTYLRGLKFCTFDLAQAKYVTASRITNIELKANNQRRREKITPAVVRALNRREFNTGAYLDTIPTLFYVDMLPEDGSLKKMWDLRRAIDAFAELDFAANTWVRGEFICYDYQPALGK